MMAVATVSAHCAGDGSVLARCAPRHSSGPDHGSARILAMTTR